MKNLLNKISVSNRSIDDLLHVFKIINDDMFAHVENDWYTMFFAALENNLANDSNNNISILTYKCIFKVMLHIKYPLNQSIVLEKFYKTVDEVLAKPAIDAGSDIWYIRHCFRILPDAGVKIPLARNIKAAIKKSRVRGCLKNEFFLAYSFLVVCVSSTWCLLTKIGTI